MSSVLLYLNCSCCLTIMRVMLLFLVFFAVMRLARSEGSQRKTRPRDKKEELKAFGLGEEELEEACASLETCCQVPLEKLTLAHTLRVVERRIQYVARHLDEVLIPPSVTTLAESRHSFSFVESIASSLWSPSSFSLREASLTSSDALCHIREIMPLAGGEGSTHPIQAQPLPKPPVQSRRDRREQTTGLDQRSARGLDFNIRRKHLQSQLGPPPLYAESLAQMIPTAPALCPPDGDPRVKFSVSRVPFLSYEVREELDCHVHTKILQQEQGFPLVPQKPHKTVLPPAPQPPIPGELSLGERDTNQPQKLNTDQPTLGFPAKVPKPPRSDASPQRAQEIQEPCVCPSGAPPPKAHCILASPDALLTRLVPKAVAKLQDHVAQKGSEIRTKAFPKKVRESHRNAALLIQMSRPVPFHPAGEQGKPRTAAFPVMEQEPAQPIKLHKRHKRLVMQWGQPMLDPEPLAKLPPAIPARGAEVEFSEMETDFLLDEVRENLGWHMQRKKLQQEWGLPDAQQKSWLSFLPTAPKPSARKAKPKLEVVPILTELLFLERDVKKQLESHVIKMQVQQKWGLPRRIQDSLRRFMSPALGERGQLSHPTYGGIVTPYLSPFLLRSKKAQSIQLPLRTPSKRRIEDVRVLPTDTRQKTARSYSWKHAGAAASKEKETPAHRSASQTGKQSAGSTHSIPPTTAMQDTTMETGGSDGTAGNQHNPDLCTTPAGGDLTSPPPGTKMTEQMLAATLHIYRSEVRKPLPSVNGTEGTEEKLELHMERKVISGEGSCPRPGAKAGEDRADLPRTQHHQGAPEAPDSGHLTRAILDSLIAGQASHDLQIKHLMDMLSSSHPSAGRASVGYSVCRLCRKTHPGKMKGKKTQEETQVSAESHGLRDITAPRGFDGAVNSKLFREQPPLRVCKKCSKPRRKTPAGPSGADLPRRSPGVPQRFTPRDSSAPSNHKMPVVWLLPADRIQDGMGKRAPTKQPKKVSVATSTTGLSQAGEKTSVSPGGSPPKPANVPRARTPPPPGKKVPVLKRIFMCLKKTFSKLQGKVKSRTSPDSRSRSPDTKFTKPPFWKLRASKGVRFPYY